MAVSPVEVTLELTPRARFDIIDVRERLREAHGDLLDVYPQPPVSLVSHDRRLSRTEPGGAVAREKATVAPYVEVFRTMFPEGAGYEHDQLDRRKDLTTRRARGRTAQRRLAPGVHGRGPQHLRQLRQSP